MGVKFENRRWQGGGSLAAELRQKGGAVARIYDGSLVAMDKNSPEIAAIIERVGKIAFARPSVGGK
ncbi:MAG: hypothetical protein LBU36_00355 [Clostridiales bacterium]|nr:hypothetical protein [Clostridiales bacterium]